MRSQIRIMVPGRETMPLEITQREMNGIYLLALKGRLVLGQESGGLLGNDRQSLSHPAPRGLSLIWSKSIMLTARASAPLSKCIERQRPKRRPQAL